MARTCGELWEISKIQFIDCNRFKCLRNYPTMHQNDSKMIIKGTYGELGEISKIQFVDCNRFKCLRNNEDMNLSKFKIMNSTFRISIHLSPFEFKNTPIL